MSKSRIPILKSHPEHPYKKILFDHKMNKINCLKYIATVKSLEDTVFNNLYKTSMNRLKWI